MVSCASYMPLSPHQKLLQKTLFYVLVSSWIEEKDQCARSERASDQSELGIGLFAEYVRSV